MQNLILGGVIRGIFKILGCFVLQKSIFNLFGKKLPARMVTVKNEQNMIFGFRNREFPSECREVEYHNDENVILACPYTNRNSNRDCVDGVSVMFSTIKTCDITF